MFKLIVENMSFDQGLQIIQADVQVMINNKQVIHEALCVDMGLPSLVRSIERDVSPNRWSTQWEDMPFFICGCGDPECKAYSFVVRHLPTGEIQWTEVEEREHEDYRIYDSWVIQPDQYREEIKKLVKQFLRFVEPLDYQPYFKESLDVIKKLD
ncbi:hypothetical protein [Ammoniphilus sp. YIM 78166]|uniref:hypothetical protein n=1 Tax=Ammoniphilus sp. YIM 78166 TaxID=1644106 RepID=UPI00106FBD9A|nr:hypothetical protein [Ammoniphilus sp. YIM 78166]